MRGVVHVDRGHEQGQRKGERGLDEPDRAVELALVPRVALRCAPQDCLHLTRRSKSDRVRRALRLRSDFSSRRGTHPDARPGPARAKAIDRNCRHHEHEPRRSGRGNPEEVRY
jgi:hypothetical protein